MDITIYDEQYNTYSHGGASIFNSELIIYLKDENINLKIICGENISFSRKIHFIIVKFPYIREILYYPFLYLYNKKKGILKGKIIFTSTFSLFFSSNHNKNYTVFVHALFYLQIKNIQNLYNKNVLLKIILYVLFNICKFIEINSLKKSNIIISPRNTITSILHKDLKNYKGKIYTIPQFVDPKKMYYIKDVPKIIDILFIGRGTRAKGFHDLIELIKLSPKLNFTVIGKKIDKNLINSFDNVNYYTNISHNELLHIYNKSKILFMPSYSETGPLVTIEAITCGVPVLCSLQGGGEFILNNYNGIVYEKFQSNEVINNINNLFSNYEYFRENCLLSSKKFYKEDILKEIVKKL
ncbi:MAG: glycosyltransferase [Candidatus Gracilibacteria bacterium]|nr:glycosyltransferase [Candidatus Gracilibacteria bacterium]